MRQKGMFFRNSLAFSMIQQILAIWSLVLLPFPKSSLYSWKFLVHILLKHSLKGLEHILGGMWNEDICMVVAKAETPVLWPPHAKGWLIGKDPDARRDWGQEEKGTTEDEMVGWHHWLDAHEFGWSPGVGDGQGGLACCDSWGCKESDMTEQLNWTELIEGKSGIMKFNNRKCKLWNSIVWNRNNGKFNHRKYKSLRFK